MTSYAEKRQRLMDELRASASGAIGLNKDRSNLFRDRQEAAKKKLNVRDFNQVLQVDTSAGWVETEGMTSYESLVNGTLAYGMMPAVVPELKSITIGGAVSGIGIESSSFKYGLVHETVLEMEVLLADGSTVVCTPDNEHRALFFGFPNSYGTLGYALKLKVKTVPVKKYVQLQHIAYTDSKAYFQELDHWCRQNVDFIDGTVFTPDRLYLTIGTFVEEAPFISDYTFMDIYYQSIPKKKTDYLTTLDYIWRWDTDWFWCSKNLYVQNPWLRRIVGKSFLNSVSYTKVMRWNSKWQLIKKLDRLRGIHSESVIQDVDIPIANAPAFLEFFQREIGISPIWICPVHTYNPNARFSLFPMNPDTVYINFGFWDVVKSRRQTPPGHYNRKIEAKVTELGGIKSLYSDSFYTQEEFWNCYDQAAYRRLKAQYDPNGALLDLYQKTVLRA